MLRAARIPASPSLCTRGILRQRRGSSRPVAAMSTHAAPAVVSGAWLQENLNQVKARDKQVLFRNCAH